MPAAPAPSKPARPRPRAGLRRAAKWGGLAGTIITASLLLASLRWSVLWHRYYPTANGCDGRAVSITAGQVYFYASWDVPMSDNIRALWSGPAPPTWRLQRAAPPRHWWGLFRWGAKELRVHVPLWIPLLLLGISTLILFHHDRPSARRRRAGQCPNCGYDRAGLAPGAVCPECGRA